MPIFTLFLITNHKPRVRGTDHGIWRRLNLIPWTQKFWREWMGETGPPELKADSAITEKLAEECSGVLAWMVRGCLEWQRLGLQAPECVRVATKEYRSAEDVIGQFVSQMCVRLPTAKVKFSQLYSAYEEWCEANGERPAKGKTFSGWLQQEELDSYTSNGTWYTGIGMKV